MILGLRLAGHGEGAALAEDAVLDFILLGGAGTGPIGCDPLSVAAFLMTTTRRIGLVASLPDTWAPFHVARALASFDHLSAGRCGWLASPDPAPGEMGAAARSAEHLDVVLQLFDSWDDDALVFDKAASVFADRAKVRRVRHEGVFFTVDGPLNAPRPPQGRPVLFQTAASATKAADIVLVDAEALDLAAGARPAAGAPRRLGEVPLDLGDGAADRCEALVQRLARAYAAGACDGFVLGPAHPATDIPMLTRAVIPRLQALGLAARSYAAGDFRTRLGLPRPLNRFASSPPAPTLPGAP